MIERNFKRYSDYEYIINLFIKKKYQIAEIIPNKKFNKIHLKNNLRYWIKKSGLNIKLSFINEKAYLELIHSEKS